MNKPVPPVVIVGCGDIGTQVARHYLESDRQVVGLVRSSASAKRLEALGMKVLQQDLAINFRLAADIQNSLMFIFTPPPPEGEKDSHIYNLLNTLQQSAQHPARIVYISTTGVYGNCEGRWITEDEPVNPQADRAKRRLDAEQQLLRYSQQNDVEVIILRVAGIYGPGKLPLARLRKGSPVIRESDAPYTNRIHSADLVNIAVAAMDHGKPGEIYHACDGHPGTMTDYFRRVAAKAGLPTPPEISLSEGYEKLSPGMMSYMLESRRLSNKKTLRELGVELLYPTLDIGLEHCGL
jgi:nucleoside-diphosphate-sugar epimerase